MKSKESYRLSGIVTSNILKVRSALQGDYGSIKYGAHTFGIITRFWKKTLGLSTVYPVTTGSAIFLSRVVFNIARYTVVVLHLSYSWNQCTSPAAGTIAMVGNKSPNFPPSNPDMILCEGGGV